MSQSSSGARVRVGAVGQLWDSGYRFDTGPSVLTMQGVLARTFAAAGTEIDDHLRLHRLDPAYRATFADGSEIRVRADRAAMAAEIEAVAGVANAAGFHRFVDWVTDLYRAEFSSFIERDLRNPLSLAKHPIDLARLVQLRGFTRLQSRVEDFFTDERLRRLFSFPGAIRRPVAPTRAGAVRRHLLHGLRRWRLVPRRGHAFDRGGSCRRSDESRSGIPLQHRG